MLALSNFAESHVLTSNAARQGFNAAMPLKKAQEMKGEKSENSPTCKENSNTAQAAPTDNKDTKSKIVCREPLSEKAPNTPTSIAQSKESTLHYLLNDLLTHQCLGRTTTQIVYGETSGRNQHI